MTFTLRDFVTESNRIEGLPPATGAEVAAHELFLLEAIVSVGTLRQFVRAVAGAELRERRGMDVRVGLHVPPPGGADIPHALHNLLIKVVAGSFSIYEVHCRYETLHPFMDGNGRSGRALWLHMMGGIHRAPLGFLHHFYYQSLDARRKEPAALVPCPTCHFGFRPSQP